MKYGTASQRNYNFDLLKKSIVLLALCLIMFMIIPSFADEIILEPQYNNRGTSRYYFSNTDHGDTLLLNNVAGTTQKVYANGAQTIKNNPLTDRVVDTLPEANVIYSVQTNSTVDGGALYNTSVISNVIADYIASHDASDTDNAIGGAVYNSGTIASFTSNFIGNKAIYTDEPYSAYGGAVYNTNTGTISSINGDFIGNYAKTEGSTASGGAIYNAGTISSVNGNFIGNYAHADSGNVRGGAIYNEGTLNIIANGNTIKFSKNYARVDNAAGTALGGAVYSDDTNGAVLTLKATNGGKIIFDEGIVNATNAENSIYIKGFDTVDSFNAYADANSSITINSKLTLEDDFIDVNYDGTNEAKGTVSLNGPVETIDGTGVLQAGIVLHSGTLNLGTAMVANTATDSIDTFSARSVAGNIGTLNVANGLIQTLHINDLQLHNNMNYVLDADLANETVDKLNVTNFSVQDGSINISDVRILSDSAENKNTLSLPIFDGVPTNELKNAIACNIQGKTGYSPIYKYNISYNSSVGNLVFERYISPSAYASVNPAIMAAAVASQLGGLSNQLESYEQGFSSMDTLMNMTSMDRMTLVNRNRYAIQDSTPVYTASAQKGLWLKPYTSFEKVNLNNGPQANSITYGTYFGGDSDIYTLKHNWNAMHRIFAGYNGSYQYFDNVSTIQNGGTLGIASTFFKKNFFTGVTVSVGDSAAEASTMYGREYFNMLNTGLASKTGYNFEFKNGKFIFQPNIMLAYSFINTFNYTNAAGVDITSDPLHAITIRPELKFMSNLKNGWSPYISVAMVWNAMDKARFNAYDIALPEVSIAPYVQYGVGVVKRFGDRCTGYGQAMIRNGGRNGLALSFGFKWALGKDPKKIEKVQVPNLNYNLSYKKD